MTEVVIIATEFLRLGVTVAVVLMTIDGAVRPTAPDVSHGNHISDPTCASLFAAIPLPLLREFGWAERTSGGIRFHVCTERRTIPDGSTHGNEVASPSALH